MGEWKDPRGERRRIVSVEFGVKDTAWKYVTLDCGHVCKANPIFSYLIGSNFHCLQCQKGGQGEDKWVCAEHPLTDVQLDYLYLEA
jgi:hypothetical protein